MFKVIMSYRGRKSSTTFMERDAADMFAATMRKQGVRAYVIGPKK